MFDSTQLFQAMLTNAFRGTPLATLINGMNAAGVAAADGVGLVTGLSSAITGVTPATDAPAGGADAEEAKALLLAKAMIASPQGRRQGRLTRRRSCSPVRFS